MPEFLHLVPPEEARQRWLPHITHRLPTETVPTAQALGRVTAEAVVAPHPMPPFPRSAVDGYAVRAADTYGASESLPAYLTVVGEVPMGAAPAVTVGPGQAALIHTGGMLPPGADAVVMVEHTQMAREGEVEVLRPVAVGENVIALGEDVAQGETVLPPGIRIRAAEIGGLMALGIVQVPVVREPKVGILSTGDEVVAPEDVPGPGQVRDVNTYTLSAQVRRWGGVPVAYGILPDRRGALEEAARRALAECDLVVVTAGSSASVRDMTAEVLDALGEPGVLVHGVATKPGRPTILAVADGKPVIGLPGNPVSALVNTDLFVRPALERLLGMQVQRPRPVVRARVTVNLASEAGREDWWPVRLRATPEGWEAEPIFYKSNLIFRLVEADGLLKVPADATGLAAGEWAEVVLEVI
jgi:molybdenum cofactor synthesis domain